MAAYRLHRAGKILFTCNKDIQLVSHWNFQSFKNLSTAVHKSRHTGILLSVCTKRTHVLYVPSPHSCGYRFASTVDGENISVSLSDHVRIVDEAQKEPVLAEIGKETGPVVGFPSGYIPEPPRIPGQNIVPESIPEPATVIDVLQSAAVAEPSFLSQGLGGWSPVGLLQTGFEHLHITFDLPWWGSIAIATVLIRTVLFPLIVFSQRYAANMNNNLPQMQHLQMKITNARTAGDTMEVARLSQELWNFMSEKKINPLKNMMVPLVQMPVFISYFIGLREMANLPVESMKMGGMYWFENLTIADPFYILPLITSTTLFVVIEIGAESGMRSDNLQTMKYIFRAIPIVMFPFIINFPAAILCYWVTNNFISLLQVAILRYEPVRAKLKIPKLEKHSKTALPLSNKGFMEGFKENYTNSKIAKEIGQRHQLDEMRFKNAGTGPIVKTYAFDPTKQSTAQHAASSSTRSAPIKK